jgi:hypothetical protein
MLLIAFLVLSAAVALGTSLAIQFMRFGRRVPWLVGGAHGTLGILGLTALLLARTRGPVLGAANGVSSFISVALTLGFAALVLGLGIVALRRRSGRGIGLAIGVHATFAVTAYVLLLAYVSLA